MAQSVENIPLPKPVITGEQSLEQLLQQRRSVREYRNEALTLAEIGQLLWAAQGITHQLGYRTAPSAGALYPLELYVVAGLVEGLDAGVYHYRPLGHRLQSSKSGDHRKRLTEAALGQSWLKSAAVMVVIMADFERVTWKYGERGIRYVHMELGHAAQNLFLQAEALGLVTVVVGAFEDEEVAAVLKTPAELKPLMLMPVGRR